MSWFLQKDCLSSSKNVPSIYLVGNYRTNPQCFRVCICSSSSYYSGFPDGSVGKESTCNDSLPCRKCMFDPWVGKIPWRMKWQHTSLSFPEKSHGQRSLMVSSPKGHKELDTTKHSSMHMSTHSQILFIWCTPPWLMVLNPHALSLTQFLLPWPVTKPWLISLSWRCAMGPEYLPLVNESKR